MPIISRTDKLESHNIIQQQRMNYAIHNNLVGKSSRQRARYKTENPVDHLCKGQSQQN